MLRSVETLPVDQLYGEQHFTQPPPRYTEASLVMPAVAMNSGGKASDCALGRRRVLAKKDRTQEEARLDWRLPSAELARAVRAYNNTNRFTRADATCCHLPE